MDEKYDVDLMRITIAEYRSLFDREQSQDEEDAIIAKACNTTVEKLREMKQPEYRRLVHEFFKRAREPLDEEDPKN